MVNGIVYVGSFDDKVYALNASTGATVWTATTGGQVFSSPAVANGIVYVGSDDGNVYTLSATTGARIWTATPIGAMESSPAVANGIVYVGSDDGKVMDSTGRPGQRSGPPSRVPSAVLTGSGQRGRLRRFRRRQALRLHARRTVMLDSRLDCDSAK